MPKKSYYFIYEKNQIPIEILDVYIKDNDIPSCLDDIAKIIGSRLTLKLLMTYQGKRLYIHKKALVKSKLNNILPENAIVELSKFFGGTCLDLRDASIKSVYNAAYFRMLKEQYSQGNLSLKEFCRQNNLSSTHSRKLP